MNRIIRGESDFVAYAEVTAFMGPTVTFIVPCYNLAHLLPDCVNSILSQTYCDFELLIMDDCSPDDTPDVAKSLCDSRIVYVRNERNLGHLSNYNKGIHLAQGEYVWLISADDSLRRPYVLERYMALMDNHPELGYVFCPSMLIEDGLEREMMAYSAPAAQDTIFKGHDFLRRQLLHTNCVAAPSAMARKDCYKKLSLFPPDLPYAGDWYLWCIFALHYDVGYFAEPMVNRRYHEGNMSKYFIDKAAKILLEDLIEVRWRIKTKAEAAGYNSVARRCKDAIAAGYAWEIAPKSDQETNNSITFKEFEESLRRHVRSQREELDIRSRVYTELGDYFYAQCDFMQALQYYQLALQQDLWMPSVGVKYILLRIGDMGMYLRTNVSALKRLARKMKSDR